MKILKYILLIAIFALAVNACKKIDEKDRQTYVNHDGEVTKGLPTTSGAILMKYSHPNPISDVYVVCVEGQKLGISDSGSLVKLDFVGGQGIQSCN